MRHLSTVVIVMIGVGFMVSLLSDALQRYQTLAYGPATGEVRLAGHGCAGAGGVIYAKEESDFPRCERIERLR